MSKLELRWMRKYAQSGPRYTSYPTAPNFDDSFGEQEAIAALSDPARKDAPLSLYFHLPFCESVCYFCACNVIFTKQRSWVRPYLDRLFKEMDMVAAQVADGRKVAQMHYGGGTPTFFNPDELGELSAEIRKRFDFDDDAEISIELDPRETTLEHVQVLAEAGFNRASLGVQDVDHKVQESVNRVQPIELTMEIAGWLRSHGFEGVNIDLMYGLPFQTVESYKRTIDAALQIKPDRVALFNFAYLPQMKKHQRRIDRDNSPGPEEKLEIFGNATDAFIDAGYKYIGMDHFALPDDELYLAQQDGTLTRNFQGYSTRGGCDLIGMGVTSISEVAGCYIQNHKDNDNYYERIDAGHLPTWRGLRLSEDDKLRKNVITDLICHFHLDKRRVEREFGIEFDKYFAQSLEALQTFVDDGLVELSDEEIQVTSEGRYIIRNICMSFDAYLQKNIEAGQKFSQTV